jgi:hypothetical protein
VNAFAAQGDKRVHFGLGAFVEQVDVSISWCGAPLQSYGLYPSDRYHAITQRPDDSFLSKIVFCERNRRNSVDSSDSSLRTKCVPSPLAGEGQDDG